MFGWSRKRKETVAIVGVAFVVLAGLIVVATIVVRSIQANATTAEADEPVEAVAAEPIAPPVVTYVDGVAEWRPDHEEDWAGLRAGDEITRGGVVRTEETSYVDIRLQLGTVVRVLENTEFHLATLTRRDLDVEVNRGEIVARADRLLTNQTLRFRTGTAVAGVRGTELALVESQTETVVYGLSGEVTVRGIEN